MNKATEKLLNEVIRNTDMAKDALEKLLKNTEDPQMRCQLERELSDFDALSRRASAMFAADGAEPERDGKMSRMWARMGISMHLMRDHSSRKMAEMMIEGNQIGITRLTEVLRDAHSAGPGAVALARQLRQTEQEHSAQLNAFL